MTARPVSGRSDGNQEDPHHPRGESLPQESGKPSFFIEVKHLFERHLENLDDLQGEQR